jgi:hypothetical protein
MSDKGEECSQDIDSFEVREINDWIDDGNPNFWDAELSFSQRLDWQEGEGDEPPEKPTS